MSANLPSGGDTTLSLEICEFRSAQTWEFSESGLRSTVGSRTCITAGEVLHLSQCVQSKEQQWIFDGPQIKSSTGQCLTAKGPELSLSSCAWSKSENLAVKRQPLAVVKEVGRLPGADLVDSLEAIAARVTHMGERAMGDKRSELLERLLRPNEVAAKKFEAQGAKAVAQAQVQGCGQTIHSEENMLDVDISTMSPQEKAQYVDALFRQWDPTPDSLPEKHGLPARLWSLLDSVTFVSEASLLPQREAKHTTLGDPEIQWYESTSKADEAPFGSVEASFTADSRRKLTTITVRRPPRRRVGAPRPVRPVQDDEAGEPERDREEPWADKLRSELSGRGTMCSPRRILLCSPVELDHGFTSSIPIPCPEWAGQSCQCLHWHFLGNWASAEAISEMYAILASEILGYNVVQYPSPSTMANLHYLSGCDGVVPVEECTWPALRHVGFELWESSWADPDWLAKKEQLGQRSMQMEGSFDEIHPGHWADVVNG
eukprot:g30143.t1